MTEFVDEVMVRGSAFQDLLDDITVQESGFFRHAEHFEVLARDVLPTLRQPVMIWSAGCANGQEALSLAMLLDELGMAGSVVATDISEAALARTNIGRYSAREVRGLSPARIDRYLSPVGDLWEVKAAIRERVSTVRHNLVDPLPRQVAECQVVFCRNVLIYLSPPHIRTFLDRLASVSPIGRPLFVGAAEVLWQVGDGFETVRAGDTFYYRRRGAKPRLVQPAFASHRDIPAASTRRRSPIQAAPTATLVPSTVQAATTAPELARTGQAATARGDHQSAVVAFRACAYLAPHDAMAHLHLGLALEATGDRSAATRAFGVARSTLLATDPALVDDASEGYTRDELLNLLDAKRQVATS